jgi:hypothetical protein
MRRATRSLVAVGLALSGVAVPAATAASIACAAQPGPRAVLVVDTGAQELGLCVQLDGSSVSGIRLIELANAQHGLQYRLGFGGAAVCQLAGVGPAGDDCFADHPDFWGYWQWTGGGWHWSSVGAGSSTVTDGEIEGWSWGSGQTGATHPQPPVRTFVDVCGSPPQSAPPSPAGGSPGSGGQGASGGGGGGSGGGSPGGNGGGPDGSMSDGGGQGTGDGGVDPPATDAGGGGGAPSAPAGSTSAAPSSGGEGGAPVESTEPTLAAAETVAGPTVNAEPVRSGGRPVAGMIAGAVLIAALAGMGWLLLRRRPEPR